MSLLDKVRGGSKAKEAETEEADASSLVSGKLSMMDQRVNAVTKDVTAVRGDLTQIKQLLAGFLDEYKSWKNQIATKVQSIESAPKQAAAFTVSAPNTEGGAVALPGVEVAAQDTAISSLIKIGDMLTSTAHVVSERTERMEAVVRKVESEHVQQGVMTNQKLSEISARIATVEKRLNIKIPQTPAGAAPAVRGEKGLDPDIVAMMRETAEETDAELEVERKKSMKAKLMTRLEAAGQS